MPLGIHGIFINLAINLPRRAGVSLQMATIPPTVDRSSDFGVQEGDPARWGKQREGAAKNQVKRNTNRSNRRISKRFGLRSEDSIVERGGLPRGFAEKWSNSGRLEASGVSGAVYPTSHCGMRTAMGWTTSIQWMDHLKNLRRECCYA